MSLNVYVIYDVIAEESGPLFTAKNDGVARRQYEVSRDKNGFSEEDFVLKRIGWFDPETMMIDGVKPVTISAKLDMVEEIENESGI